MNTAVDNQTTLLEGLGLPFEAPETLGFRADHLDAVSATMRKYRDADQVAGSVAIIARHGKVALLEVDGYADRETSRPMQSDALFRLFGMTKPVTAAAVMMLQDEGHFQLDDPIADFLPAFADMDVYPEQGKDLVKTRRPITIRDLLTHRAGLSFAATYQAFGVCEALGRLSGETLAQYVDQLAAFPLTAQPGTTWRYSNGYSVLARLVEIISGQTYGEFLQQRLFEPLGMHDTGFWVPPEKRQRLTRLYQQRPLGEGIAPTDGFGGDYSEKPSLETGGSGLVGTASDYLRFAQMLLGGVERDGVRLLAPESARAIMTDQLDDQTRGQAPASAIKRLNGQGYGFGGAVLTDPARAENLGSRGEYGWEGRAHTAFWIDPATDVIGLVLTQVIPLPGRELDISTRIRRHIHAAVTC